MTAQDGTLGLEKPLGGPEGKLAAAAADWQKDPGNPDRHAALAEAVQAVAVAQTDPVAAATDALIVALAGEPERDHLQELATALAAEYGKADPDTAEAERLTEELSRAHKRPDLQNAVAAATEALKATRPLKLGRKHEPNPPAQQWLIKHWLPAGRLAMLTGEGGAGKSRLALQLAAALAAGETDWINGNDELCRVEAPGEGAPVVWATWEDDHREIDRRLAVAAQQSRAPVTSANHTSQVSKAAEWCSPQRLDDRLIVADMAELGPLWGPAPGRHVSTTGELLPAGHKLLDVAAGAGARLLVLDPLAAAYGSNENDRALVRQFCATLDAWARQHGCAVLMVAHPPKNTGDPYSGSTDWRNASRAMLTLTHETRGEEDEQREEWKLSLEKSNYGPPQPPRHVRRHPPGDPGGILHGAPRGHWQNCGPWHTDIPGREGTLFGDNVVA